MYLIKYPPRNPPFCSFVSFSIVSLVLFISKPKSSRDLTIFNIFYYSSFEIVNVIAHCANSKVRPELRIFLLIPASAADATAVNPNGIKLFS